MERLQQMTAAPLHLMDKFRQELLTILDERRLPIQEQQNRINQLREQIRQEGDGQLDAFDRESQEMEKDLLRKLEELKEMRQRASLIRRVFGSMFRPG
jgi:FKBP-type peptidyl-prolyl cis-trans isomerase (trigger factor)